MRICWMIGRRVPAYAYVQTGDERKSTDNFTRDPDAAGATLGIAEAVRRYVADVKAGRFPDEAVHGF